MRILIAEDDPASRRLLEALLSKWGYEVLAVGDGEAAWAELQREDGPRMAIVDWMMPGLDGVDICRRVRQQADGSYKYIILLTARSQKGDLLQGLEAGADDYVVKPFETSELRARLHAGRRILDLQAELIRAQEKLRVQATHDPLTGLPNRLLFSDRLTQCLAQARRLRHPLAVTYLDLDRFKLINDTLGHKLGDQLLQAAAERLKSCLRETDTLARMGGDEFTIILPYCAAEEAALVARKVLDALSEAFVLDGCEVFISGSIGISVFPSDGADAESLVTGADAAMYRAKDHGRNGFQLFAASSNERIAGRTVLERDLRHALEKNEFEVYYQPRVDIRTGRVLGAEALLRWHHADQGIVLPGDFIALSEEIGLIGPISDWVLHAACAQNKAWQDAGLPPMEVAVNISGRHFQQDGLVDTIKKAVAQTGLDAQWLDLELTESTLMQNPDASDEILRELKTMGVRISVDDFGTGYSSLGCLKRFPVNAVKIDRSYVKDITTNPDSAAIAGAVVAMCRSLKLKVIAEGVETLEQLEFLRALNCDEMQGYFVSAPLPAADIERLMHASSSSPGGAMRLVA